MKDVEISAGEEYPLEFEDGEFKMRFNCFCSNEYMFSIFMYDDGTLTLKIDPLGIKEKN
jgi:hypothetical protein